MLNIGLGLAKQAVDVARRAGGEIMRVYQTDFQVEAKDDNSPVTQADKAAEDLILRSIREGITADFPIVSEEAAAAGNIPVVRDTPFWLVDPLDGTKEFVNRNGEFTVNIALIENTRPILGVVHLPAQGVSYFGFSMGAFRQKGGEAREEIKCRPAPADGLTALVSRSHKTPEVDEFLARYTVTQQISAGSSLKFCRVAEGAADIYPRMGRTMEWDTAAGHAVLRFAGGTVERLDGTELGYGKDGFENPHFVAAGGGVLVG
ncbi:MAG: 3'(2'),5'-bisphosphate nucleotidase CysQ [Magnetovibrio sp.]|nr:3'(2'),5'-bisphosphate nucleotidase CysQ [Magnetovibrio sp.]